MLVLTRKIDEQIVIGDDIKITLIRVRGNTVRLGIEAPRDVRIVRSELEPVEGHSDDEDGTDREEAFAHPADNRLSESVAAEPNLVDQKSTPVNRMQATEPLSLFVGRATRDGSQTEIRRAPLASFVSAS